MSRDGYMLCTFMVMFTQSDHPIILKFHQHQYVTMLFNPNDLDSNKTLQSLVVSGPSIKFDRVRPTLIKLRPHLSQNLAISL